MIVTEWELIILVSEVFGKTGFSKIDSFVYSTVASDSVSGMEFHLKAEVFSEQNVYFTFSIRPLEAEIPSIQKSATKLLH